MLTTRRHLFKRLHSSTGRTISPAGEMIVSMNRATTRLNWSIHRSFGNHRTPEEIEKLLNKYSRYKQTRVPVVQLLKVQDELTSYRFLRGELPTRLCHTILELESMPDLLLNRPSVREVNLWYRQSFFDILDLPLGTEISKLSPQKQRSSMDLFMEKLELIFRRHSNVVSNMALGILELKDRGEVCVDELVNLKEFLDRFYMSRIGMRTHIEHHLTKYHHKEQQNLNPGFVGCFDTQCRPDLVMRNAATEAGELCKLNYFGTAPEVEITVESDSPIVTVYPTNHLHYIGVEIFKNSMRAVVERYGEDKVLPPIKVSIYEHNRNVTIKISDLGGGIPLSVHPKLFSYAYSSVNLPTGAMFEVGRPVFAGLGYGLALSRLYCRYLGGRIGIAPIDGHGTDVFIYLKDPQIATEVLPSLDRQHLRRYSECRTTFPNITHWMDTENCVGTVKLTKFS